MMEPITPITVHIIIALLIHINVVLSIAQLYLIDIYSLFVCSGVTDNIVTIGSMR